LGAAVIDPTGYQPQQGDLVVYDGNPRHPSGHVQMYDGSQWISDFKQKHVSPYGSDVPRSTIYRLGGVAR
jgi:cell wall-associated NlpC family hydrolase